MALALAVLLVAGSPELPVVTVLLCSIPLPDNSCNVTVLTNLASFCCPQLTRSLVIKDMQVHTQLHHPLASRIADSRLGFVFSRQKLGENEQALKGVQ